jgi:hypothetical protein
MEPAEFEKEFHKGHRSYNDGMGDWWIVRSQDGPHQRAYKNIAQQIDSFLCTWKEPDPRILIDYACGNGSILKTLGKTFPSTSIVAIDGSRKMLQNAKSSLMQFGLEAEFAPAEDYYQKGDAQFRFVQTPLPNFSLPPGRADVVVFLFPNINATHRQMMALMKHVRGDRDVLATARFLAKLRYDEPDPMDAGQTVEAITDYLLFERVVCMNIHRFLRKGGLWFKVEYSGCSREQLSELEKWELLFSECAMNASVDGRKQRQLFQYLDDRYFRSSVILDVYEQSKDPELKAGGYFISVLQAL